MGRLSTGVFQMLSAGSIWQPAKVGASADDADGRRSGVGVAGGASRWGVGDSRLEIWVAVGRGASISGVEVAGTAPPHRPAASTAAKTGCIRRIIALVYAHRRPCAIYLTATVVFACQ